MATIRLIDVSKTFTPDLSIFTILQRRDRQAKREDIVKRVGEGDQKPIIALDHLNLTVPDGQTTAVVGPSGCGKSTLLRAVAGLVEVASGKVMYDDKDMTYIPVKDRRIGMVFQSYALYPHFFGKGNLSFFFKVKRAPDAEAEERIRITAEMMGYGFNELLPRRPGTLSGGQQQRLAIARALVRQPELFLFDEPLSNLDAKLRTRTRVEIKRLLHRFSITAIYVTHDQTEAISIGDEIAVMRAGRIEQVGSYRAILDAPLNSFVAGFLGSPPMNLLDGEVADRQLRLDGINVQIPESVLGQVSRGQKVTLGIRPEAIQLAVEAGSEEHDTLIHGVIEVVEPDYGRRAQTALIRTGALSYRAVAPLELHLEPGYPIDAVFPASALYFFDTAGEQRIGT